MFIYNLKLNSTIIFRIIITLFVIIALIILLFSTSKIFSNDKFFIEDKIPSNSIANIESNKYTNILKEVYENIDSYVGQSINFTGYIYKLYDLKESEFVLARDMLINSDSQTVVVGFLCSYKDAKKFKEGTWVNITGTIIKGYYHNEIPIIDIKEMKETDKPKECYVYPPDDTFIPTSTIL